MAPALVEPTLPKRSHAQRALSQLLLALVAAALLIPAGATQAAEKSRSKRGSAPADATAPLPEPLSQILFGQEEYATADEPDLPPNKKKKKNAAQQPIVSTPLAEEPVEVALNPEFQARIDAMQTAAAWAYLDKEYEQWKHLLRAKSAGILDPFRAQRERVWQIAAMKARARQMKARPVSMDVFDVLCDDLAAALATNLSGALGDRTPKSGSKFVLVVGRVGFVFSDTPGSQGAAVDQKLKLLIQRVIDRIGANPAIGEKFVLISAPTADSSSVLKMFGGDSAQWVSEDGRNYREAFVQDYHPDDIYVLLGEMIQESGGAYSELYDTSCRLMHPRSQGQAAIGTPHVRTTMLCHPSRGWITKALDSTLATSVPRN